MCNKDAPTTREVLGVLVCMLGLFAMAAEWHPASPLWARLCGKLCGFCCFALPLHLAAMRVERGL